MFTIMIIEGGWRRSSFFRLFREGSGSFSRQADQGLDDSYIGAIENFQDTSRHKNA
jgi:hypothetical protein